jgi:predicted RNase H-like nuclease (RuvC/YqgF family)
MNYEETTQQIEELRRLITRLERDFGESQERISDLQRHLTTAETRLKERASVADVYMFSRIITGTTDGSVGTATTHSHSLGRTPSFVFLTPESNGVVYLTDKDKDKITVKGSASSLDFTAYLLA